MTQTPNHGYNVPEEGEQDWHEPLNENFEAYDTDIELRDEEANLGSYEPEAGAKFLATDTGLVYVGDGNDWVATLVAARYVPPSDPDNVGSVVFGGSDNDVDSVDAATVGGGPRNRADANWATIGGGHDNRVLGQWGTIAGGFENSVGSAATVGGGNVNEATGDQATIAGGVGNEASGDRTTIAGGTHSVASGVQATIGGGNGNEASGEHATVAGGSDNLASGEHATVAGGGGNTASGTSTVGGGTDNAATWRYSTIAGGQGNESTSSHTTVGGGAGNTADGHFGTVAGGTGNETGEQAATVGGGENNQATSMWATVSGGTGNTASGRYATVPGGDGNEATGDHTFAAGWGANAIHSGSFVWAGGSAGGVASTDRNQFIVSAPGGVGLGTNAPQEALHVNPDDSHIAAVLESADGADGWGIGTGMNSGNFNFYNAGDVSGSWDILARIHNDTGEYEVASDARLKEDIEPLEGVLDDVCSLAPRSYRFERAGEDSPRSYGFLAQEVREVFPDLVREDEADDFLGVAYDGFAALAVQAVREQQTEVETQADALDELETENEQLREDLAAKDDRIDELEARLDRLEERTASMVAA